MSIAPANLTVVPAAPLGIPAEEACGDEITLDSLRRFTVEEYHQLIDDGFFSDDEAYELLEGLLVHKMGKKRRHSLGTRRLRKFLEPMLDGF